MEIFISTTFVYLIIMLYCWDIERRTTMTMMMKTNELMREEKSEEKIENEDNPILIWYNGGLMPDIDQFRICLRRLPSSNMINRLRQLKEANSYSLTYHPHNLRNDEIACRITKNKDFVRHANFSTFLFYGTETNELPFPKEWPSNIKHGKYSKWRSSLSHPRKWWALYHEESPKNQELFSSSHFSSLFDVSATIQNLSDIPLTLHSLPSINYVQEKRFMKSFHEKELLQKRKNYGDIIYIQSACNPPSDRETLVSYLSNYFQIDSYGKCLNNRSLPSNLRDAASTYNDDNLHRIIAQYKLVLAFENGICDDYITEKLWRSFYVGTIPIYFGSPTVQQWLPTNDSVIFVNRHEHIDDLVNEINETLNNQQLYEKRRRYKYNIENKKLISTMNLREYETNNENILPSSIAAFECEACRHAHQMTDKERETDKKEISSYYCEEPKAMEERFKGFIRSPNEERDLWVEIYRNLWLEGKANGRRIYDEVMNEKEQKEIIEKHLKIYNSLESLFHLTFR
ncbi:hypothetical protein SNEBB_009090 [Seison nebaliae]|nr:hypothetical protein SNEBB_009090 [Seison nebaliae]